MGGGNDATSVVNDAIDDAFSATGFFDTLMENESYHDQYYAYLRQLVSEYIDGGGFDAFYERVRSQIDELVETDPTAFYSYDEYLTAADTLYQVVKLRGEAIQGQLDGTIPSTEAEQRGSDALVDASALDLSVMGSMNTGGRDGFKAETSPANAAEPDGSEAPATPDVSAETGDTSPSDSAPPQSSGGLPDGAAPPQFGGENQSTADDAQASDESASKSGGGFGGGPSAGDFPGSGSAGTAQAASMKNLALYGASLLVFLAALLFAVLYRRKPKKR